MKLFVHKTVTCEVINVEFLNRDVPLKMCEIIMFIKRNVLD